MPPCHGGDRRFESGRARQEKRPNRKMGLFSWPGSRLDLNKAMQICQRQRCESPSSVVSHSPQRKRAAGLTCAIRSKLLVCLARLEASPADRRHPVEPAGIDKNVFLL